MDNATETQRDQMKPEEIPTRWMSDLKISLRKIVCKKFKTYVTKKIGEAYIELWTQLQFDDDDAMINSNAVSFR